MIINSCHKFKLGQKASVVFNNILTTIKINSILHGMYRGNYVYDVDIVESPSKKVYKMTFKL